jgi:hypothetical protein
MSPKLLLEEGIKMKKIIILVIVLITAGCASYGPDPTEMTYRHAVSNFPPSKQAVYIVPAQWIPNVLLGDTESFHASHVDGTLFLTEDSLIFAAYDGSTDTFLQDYAAAYREITYITGKNWGMGRIIRLQANNNVQSFMQSGGYKQTGEAADKDEIMRFILSKFKPQPTR